MQQYSGKSKCCERLSLSQTNRNKFSGATMYRVLRLDKFIGETGNRVQRGQLAQDTLFRFVDLQNDVV